MFFGYEDVFAKFHEVASVIFHIDYKPRDAWKNDIGNVSIFNDIFIVYYFNITILFIYQQFSKQHQE